MTPVFQTIVDDKHGDCLRAAFASILDLPLEEVPNFSWEYEEDHRGSDVPGPQQKWLTDRGLYELELWMNDVSEDTYNHLCAIACSTANLGPVYALGCLPSQRYPDKSHAVVIRINGYKKTPWVEVVHDPNAMNAPYDLNKVRFRSISFIIKHFEDDI